MLTKSKTIRRGVVFRVKNESQNDERESKIEAVGIGLSPSAVNFDAGSVSLAVRRQQQQCG
jgi:hypothetical protein